MRIADEIKQIFSEKYNGDVGVIDELIKADVIDLRRVKIALIRKEFDRLIRKGVPSMQAIFETAEKYSVSEKTAENAIYLYKGINL